MWEKTGRLASRTIIRTLLVGSFRDFLEKSGPSCGRISRLRSGMGSTKKAPWPRVRVETWAQFQNAIEHYLDGEYLFRGVTSVDHFLIPSVGRSNRNFTYSEDSERELFEQFKREALP